MPKFDLKTIVSSQLTKTRTISMGETRHDTDIHRIIVLARINWKPTRRPDFASNYYGNIADNVGRYGAKAVPSTCM